MSDQQNDEYGVVRDGLDYRAGWVEGLAELARQINIASIRAKPKEATGLERAFNIAKAMRDDMIAKMKGGS
jgi:hypothetical protein